MCMCSPSSTSEGAIFTWKMRKVLKLIKIFEIWLVKDVTIWCSKVAKFTVKMWIDLYYLTIRYICFNLSGIEWFLWFVLVYYVIATVLVEVYELLLTWFIYNLITFLGLKRRFLLWALISPNLYKILKIIASQTSWWMKFVGRNLLLQRVFKVKVGQLLCREETLLALLKQVIQVSQLNFIDMMLILVYLFE